ncbi:type II CRISPR-associated endonuclease Cas1 [Campylobacter geochelonis]|uniref:CRISPR-associated endonuclease Cas1 n=1 Tax=Campylobacter geochelonis TaxID=1780362 RepID=A0A128EPU3_9BACT|nr:type II CRISPR-associated endonuclease Cas1 [Campylobacter geochelonis]QKF70455.1 CRISPR/Cas system-associated endonuclease Cas1 [Campylobacter geochelonis]CZE46250.1 CRISPR-associated protein [Campylobacter geochelonis]CZE50650.1 CRISPR-associated protein [Campylobacter geochelonis]
MSWRVVCVSGVAKLDLKFGFMVVRKDEISKVAINEIATVIIDSTAVSLTTALLNEFMKKKIKVIFCDEKHNPSSELMSYYGSHDSSLKIKEQITWNKDIKELVWTKIVKFKIIKQKALLEKLGFEKEANLLQGYISELILNDTTNREGHAAKVYFNALFGIKFSRDDDNPTNSALNYGYSLLLSSFNKEISANGYITQLGLFHDNRFNPFNLASDLMEIFRPIVDEIVLNLASNNFAKDEKIKVLTIFNKKVFIAKKEHFLPNAISIYTKSIFEALNNDDENLLEIYDEF